MDEEYFASDGILGSPIDDIFAYQTVKVVRIQDRWLGIWDLCCKIFVLLLVIFYFVMWKHGYLEWEPATGTISMRILGGVRGVNASSLTYCAQKNCRLVDRYSVATWDSKSIFIDTYVEEIEQKRQCAADEPVCPFESAFEDFQSTEYFTAGVEDMILEIRHDVQAATFFERSLSQNFKGSSSTMDGSLVSYLEDENGDKAFVKIKDIAKDSIKLSLRDIVSAAGLDLDSPATSNGTEALRRTGSTLVARIKYSNIGQWWEVSPKQTIHFTLQFSLVDYAASRTFEPVGFGDERMLVKRSGLRIVVLQDGMLGAFSWLALLQTLAGGYILLRLLVWFNDWLAGKILPLDHFESAKYEYTENIPAVRNALRIREDYKALSDAGACSGIATTPQHDNGARTGNTGTNSSGRARRGGGNERHYLEGRAGACGESPASASRGGGLRVQVPPPMFPVDEAESGYGRRD